VNPILQLKGQFQQNKNTSSPGARNLPNGQFVSVEHINDLINQLKEILGKREFNSRRTRKRSLS